MTDTTKKYKKIYIALAVLSILLLVGPLLSFTIIGLATATVANQLILSLSVVAAVIFTLISLMTKTAFRSTIFLVLFGLYFALDFILPVILVIGAATILDEVVVTPLKNHYKTKYTINKEIDKRG